MTSPFDILTAKNEPSCSGVTDHENGGNLRKGQSFDVICVHSGRFGQCAYDNTRLKSWLAGHHVLWFLGMTGKCYEQLHTATSLGGGRATPETSKQKVFPVSITN